MIWLAVTVVLIILIVTASLTRYESRPDETHYRVAADLYAIRRRLDVEEFKQEVRRDARRLKRELDKELGE